MRQAYDAVLTIRSRHSRQVTIVDSVGGVTHLPSLSPTQLTIVERALELKEMLIDFALQPHLQRPLREQVRRVRHERLDSEAQMIEAIESLLFEHRFDDGTTVLDRFAARRPERDPIERELLATWSDSVHGIFEVGDKKGDLLRATNLFDDLSYICIASAGPGSIAEVVPGSFLITRILPAAGVWILSGSQALFPAEDRDGLATVVADRALEDPELVLRNPEYRQSAERSAAALHQNFLDCFGTDLIVTPGVDTERRYREFLTFHTKRVTSDRRALDRVADMAAESEAQARFADADTVAMHSHPMAGVSFYTDYAAVAAIFDDPALATGPAQQALVRAYLDEETIPPWVIVRLAEQSPDADAVFTAVLKRSNFCWSRDGESLLRKHKPSYNGEPVNPGVTVLPTIALERYRVGSVRTRQRAGFRTKKSASK